MFVEGMLTGVVVTATAVLFVACCMQIVRVSFSERASRADVRLAAFRVLAFAVSIIGCLAFTDACGNAAAALYACALCLAAMTAGRFLARSWRANDAAELDRMAELRSLVEHYRMAEDSLESRCSRAAREHDLTRREEEVLALLLKGRSRAEMARELYVSGDTVKTHIRNLYRKTGVAGKDELVKNLGVQEQRPELKA